MAKGKYTRSAKNGEDDMLRRFSRALQEEEGPSVPSPTANPLDLHEEQKPQNMEDRSMPDFDSISDLDFLKELNFPELSSLDTQSESSEYSSVFTPIPQRKEPSEEEKQEKIMESAYNRQNRTVPPVRSFWHRGGKKLLISLLVVFAVVFLSMGGLTLYQHLADPYEHLILNGVTVAGVNVGGMTRDQAEQAVSAAADSLFRSTEMVVKLPEQSLTLSPAASRISLDTDAAVKAAYSYGRTGSRREKEEDYRSSMTETHAVDLLPFLEVDSNYILKQLEGYADAHDSSFTPSSYALEGERPPLDLKSYNEKNTPQTLLLILGNPGFRLDPQSGLQEILKAYSALNFNPSLTLTAGEKEPDSLDLKKIHAEYHVEPVNSAMDLHNFDVISGSYGYTFDLQAAERMLQEAHYGDTVRVPMEYVTPEVVDDQVYFQDVLGRAETPHGSNENRNINLALACKALDGLVLNPGDEFSYNETLGQRTAEKGYKGAPAYSGDKLVDSIGGGICQVSSTLYYACLLSDLEITDRINHGFLPSYIDPGMDATVSWGKPDYKFKNNTDFPIKLKAETTEDKVIIEVLGTDNKDYYVKMEYTMSYSDPPEVRKEFGPESGYVDGQILEGGTPSHHVKTFRCKYSKKTDVLISKELETRSSYMSRPRIIASVPQAPVNPEVPDVTTPETTPPDPTNPTPS